MPGPIKPSEVDSAKANCIPEEVFKAFNSCIAKNWSGNIAKFTQKEAVATIVGELAKIRTNTTSKELVEMVYENNWLDVEPAYRAVGWKVEYDRPGYNEDYPPTFSFAKS